MIVLRFQTRPIYMAKLQVLSSSSRMFNVLMKSWSLLLPNELDADKKKCHMVNYNVGDYVVHMYLFMNIISWFSWNISIKAVKPHRTADFFDIKHLVPDMGDSPFDEELHYDDVVIISRYYYNSVAYI